MGKGKGGWKVVHIPACTFAFVLICLGLMHLKGYVLVDIYVVFVLTLESEIVRLG